MRDGEPVANEAAFKGFGARARAAWMSGSLKVLLGDISMTTLTVSDRGNDRTGV